MIICNSIPLLKGSFYALIVIRAATATNKTKPIIRGKILVIVPAI